MFVTLTLALDVFQILQAAADKGDCPYILAMGGRRSETMRWLLPTLKTLSAQGTLEQQQGWVRMSTFTECSEDAFVSRNT